MRRAAALAIALCAACAAPRPAVTRAVPTAAVQASSASASPASVPSANGPATVSAPAPEPPGLRARIAVVFRDGKTVDNWVDLEVAGTGEAERRACALVLNAELQELHRGALSLHAGAWARIERQCEPGPLPVLTDGKGAVLVNPEGRQEAGSAALIPAVLRGDAPPAGPEASVPVELTRFTRFGSAAECQQRRAKLLARWQKAAADADARARQWLADEKADLERRRDEACQKQKESQATQEREAVEALGRRPHESEGAYNERALRADARQLETAHFARECQQYQQLVEVVGKRETTLAPTTFPEPTCR